MSLSTNAYISQCKQVWMRLLISRNTRVATTYVTAQYGNRSAHFLRNIYILQVLVFYPLTRSDLLSGKYLTCIKVYLRVKKYYNTYIAYRNICTGVYCALFSCDHIVRISIILYFCSLLNIYGRRWILDMRFKRCFPLWGEFKQYRNCADKNIRWHPPLLPERASIT